MTSKINTLADLHRYLGIAIQLEHATLPAYLTALYSIETGTNLEAVNILRVVAVEEMLHMTIAANVLNAVGGKVDLTAPGFVPDYPTYLPTGIEDFKVHLERFSRSAIDTFMKIERPDISPESEAGIVCRSLEMIARSILRDAIQDDTLDYYSIGDFYAAIQTGILELEAEARAAGTTIFTGDPALQVSGKYYYSGGGELWPVVDQATALTALELIIGQGEGAGGGIYDREGEIAHYYRYEELILGRHYQKGDEPGLPTGPTFTVEWDKSYPIMEDCKLKYYPDGAEVTTAAMAFNAMYADFLAVLNEAYNGKPDTLLAAVPAMFQLRNAMSELMRNPLPGSDGLNAAPTFEIGTTASASTKGASA